MEYERYTDEKHPDGVHHVEVLEPLPQKPKRPLWRRVVRFLLTAGAIFMVWSTFAPIFSYTRCHRPNDNMHRPPQPDLSRSEPISSDLIETMMSGGDGSGATYEHYTFPADLKSFWLKQESFTRLLPTPTRTQVVGKVIVHSCPKAENISTYFRLSFSEPWLRESILIEPHSDGILFKLDPYSSTHAKVNATVLVVVPKSDEYSLDRLSAGTIQLPILLKDTFTTHINATSLDTISGNVFAFGKAADKKALDIANLHVGTVSGSIDGEFPLIHAVDLESTSGTITASIVSANLEEQIGYIKTSTVSGDHAISFLGKLNPRPLYSTHNSVSGNIDVKYPEDWQGGLKLKTTSGHINVRGKGTKVVKKDKDIVGRFWKVIKGDGKSKGSLGSISGTIDVLIGKDE